MVLKDSNNILSIGRPCLLNVLKKKKKVWGLAEDPELSKVSYGKMHRGRDEKDPTVLPVIQLVYT